MARKILGMRPLTALVVAGAAVYLYNQSRRPSNGAATSPTRIGYMGYPNYGSVRTFRLASGAERSGRLNDWGFRPSRGLFQVA